MRLPQSQEVDHLVTVDSTNLEAGRLFQSGQRGPLWIWADEQTAGRGRLGRIWHSPHGNLYATLLWQCEASQTVASQIGFVAALAVRDAVKDIVPDAELLLKWPNDVLLRGGKFCGLLAEALQASPLVMAVGFGINLASAPHGLPYPTAFLGAHIKPAQMLEKLAAAFQSRIGQWQNGLGFDRTREDWLAASLPMGALLFVDGRQGLYAGVDQSGALLLQEAPGNIEVIHAGDVRLASQQP